ncbi:adenosylcobinamide-phosphate synthase [Meinhardsimonia xiamenensis]|jgi:adenosylcobinamide-phosphate synthase|uniref:Cobalamin biosynthesis protein CobD n=1 Tax=Meinhardsimonia xiamenensis TaxID=990712 RepID=A0A1G8XQX3_9RHOB|nr:adenosylcobinamide-phosphate synthase CbiB [Meinhardsimonia xiamenensis]PRX37013.1 adenosylcobinamide-phosphate synthase [Meinhardsimonia xiamenensis]SDJ93072.1 adenosylcobinamide-phosphate synthase [Meinhardsimonia xiamenensis]
MPANALMLLPALLLDAILGEPRLLWSRLPHPAVLMGRLIDALERRLNRGRWRRAKGVLALALLIGASCAAAVAIGALPLAPVWEILAAAVLLAQRSLADHVAAVAEALERSLTEGRRAVARIVGRDTAELDGPGVARAAIESAAENLSDGVIAPAFWFLLAGLPGLAIYKAVNTADSMIGYHDARFEQFGWAAARLDDLLNWIPARLTALLCIVAGLSWPNWRELVADARRHRSPNAGWPEAALARVLGVALAGPRSYGGVRRAYPFVNPDGRTAIGAGEIRAAVSMLWRVWALFTALVAMLAALAVV